MKEFSLVLGIMLVGFAGYGQQHRGFVINGELAGLKDGTVLYLWHVPDKDKFDTIGRSIAKGGKFKFLGEIPLEGTLYHITIDTTRIKYKDTVKGSIDLLLENKDITLRGAISDLSLHHIETKGLEGQDFYKKFKLFDDSVVAEVNKVEMRPQVGVNDSMSGVRRQKELDSIHLVFVKTMRDWADHHLNSIMSPWVLIVFYKDSAEHLRELYSHMTTRIQNGKYGRDLKDIFTIANETEVGAYAPDFNLPDTKGDSLSLSAVAAHGKLTLLVFWASWCGPCRDEIPELKKMYALYHAKGLNILGYSIDESDDPWQKAIQQEGLAWDNIRDRGELANKLYGITGIPNIYLLDSHRRVVARNVQSEELESTVSRWFNE